VSGTGAEHFLFVYHSLSLFVSPMTGLEQNSFSIFISLSVFLCISGWLCLGLERTEHLSWSDQGRSITTGEGGVMKGNNYRGASSLGGERFVSCVGCRGGFSTYRRINTRGVETKINK